MQTISLEAAKEDLERLLARVSAGEEFTIVRGEEKVAVISPVAADGEGIRTGEKEEGLFNPPIPGQHPFVGMLKGKVWIAPDFDEPLEDFLPYME